ncbi:MAG: hypothetical protein U1E65_04335 [Myxococcota bacterium]
MADEDTLAWLRPMLLARAEGGSFRYSDADVRRFFAVLLLTYGADPRTMPEPVAALVGELGQVAGVILGDDPAVAQAKIEAHLAAVPLPAELVLAFQQGARGEAALRSPEELALAIGHVIGLLKEGRYRREDPGLGKTVHELGTRLSLSAADLGAGTAPLVGAAFGALERPKNRRRP